MPQSPESFLRLIHRARRGRLKVYLGYGPGVGKTYQMLLEGHRLKAQGVDAVIGVVETHDRADTASLVLGLDAIPQRQIVYRGVHLEEMDLAAILKRKPEVVLVDELAHTNVPGSTHPKRYLDVQEILAAGIHVLTTLNIQHLESLYDTVERLVGVKVKERIPDWVLAEADQVVNVDLAAEDLRRRLEEGRIYPPERAAAALQNFFRTQPLEQLRELALREAASVLERRGRAEGSSIEAPDQVVACLSSKSPNAHALLRYSSRLAGKLDRNWYALYVRTPAEERLDPETKTQLGETLELARHLGATVFTFQGEDVAETILRFAREVRAGHVVIGRSAPRPAWRRLLRPSLVEALLERATGLALVVVDPLGPAVAAGSERTERTSGTARTGEEVEPAAMKAAPRKADRLAELVRPERTFFLQETVSRGELLERLAAPLLAGTHLDLADVIRRLERREREASTYLGAGIAVPHARIPGLPEPRLALAVLRSPAGAETTIELMFVLLCPEEHPERCLKLLSDIVRLAHDPTRKKALSAATSWTEVQAALTA
ncbi:MAG: PTS sugar transporter subunit IIA [Acidobacteriota bacterium]